MFSPLFNVALPIFQLSVRSEVLCFYRLFFLQSPQLILLSMAALPSLTGPILFPSPLIPIVQ